MKKLKDKQGKKGMPDRGNTCERSQKLGLSGSAFSCLGVGSMEEQQEVVQRVLESLREGT